MRLSILWGGLLMVLSAGASTGATLQLNSAADLYQQTTASPCVFGGNNCQNPAGWSMSPSDTGNSGSYLASHTYAGADYLTFVSVASSEFILGVDVNDTAVAQTLNSLTISFNDGTSYLLSGPQSISSLANGVGRSDYTVTQSGGATISVPTAATAVTFTVDAMLNDGPDRFFVIAQGQSQPPEVPEPATFALLGTGLAAMALLRRRRWQ